MDPISTFFGISTESNAEQQRKLEDKLAATYQQLAELQSALYNLQHTKTTSYTDIHEFTDKARFFLYPGIIFKTDSSSIPATFTFGTEYTSFFYSDGMDRMMYADTPMHSFNIVMTRGGIQEIVNTGRSNYPKHYRSINIGDSRFYRSVPSHGHPHCSDLETSTTAEGHWCFGSNTGIGDLLKTAQDLSSVNILFHKLYHWLTEINIDSVYHREVFPIHFTGYEPWEDISDFGRTIYDVYKEVFTEAIDFFRNGNMVEWDGKLLEKLHTAINDAFAEAEEGTFIHSLLYALRLSMLCIGGSSPKSLTLVLCMYQFTTACVLAYKGGEHIPSIIRHAIQGDVFYAPYVWSEHLYNTYRLNLNSEINYKKTFLHYFDGFNYALKGGF